MYYDGNIGPRTREALEKAVQMGKIKNVHAIFSQKRLEHLRTLDNYNENKGGWEDRVHFFLE